MAEARPRVLVIDDGEIYARAVAEHMPEIALLTPPGSAEGRFADGPSALRYLEKGARGVDIVLLDMQFDVDDARLLPLPEGTSPRRTRRFQGIAILRKIRERFPDLPVVLFTSHEDLALIDAAEELAAQSMTYVLDGDDIDALRIRIQAALAERAEGPDDPDVLWGRDPAMRALRRRLAVLARGGMPVILEGETGTGKSYLAERFVHARSGRKGAFVVLDVSTVPRELLPAQLFGVARGAFTGAVQDRKGVFEAAHGGTLFLDEIQNAPLETQKQLLLVLQDRRVRPLGSTREVPVDVKLVAASNSELAQAVAEQRFRQDLYMRLSPATRVKVPPLRERSSDLFFFAERFLEAAVVDRDLIEVRQRIALALGLPRDAPLALALGRAAQAQPGRLELSLPEAARRQLAAHSWPGNLRELSTVMQNIATFTLVAAADALAAGVAIKSTRLQVDAGLVAGLLSASSPTGTASGAGSMRPPPAAASATNGRALPVEVRTGKTLNAVATEVERQYMLALFTQTQGSFEAMAEILLGDATRIRAVRLRFNQLGLKVRALRK